MPRPKSPAKTIEIPEDEFEQLERDREEEFEFVEFLEKYGPGSSQLKVYRVPDKGTNGTPRFVEIVQPDDLNEEIMRERYGEGIYILRFFNTAGKYLASKRVYIDALKRSKLGSDSGNLDMVSFMREQQVQQQTLMLGLISALGQGLAGGGTKGPDIGQLLAGMGSMMIAVKPAAIDPASILTSMVTAVTALSAKNGNGDDLDKISKIIEIANGLQPKNDDSLLGVARDVAGKVVDAFAGPRQQTQQQQAHIEERPAIPAGASMAQQINAPNLNREEMMIGWLKAQLNYLKGKAAIGKDVDFWVDSTFENQEEPGNSAILEALQRGATIEHLLQFDPEIAQNAGLKDWFTRFYNGVYSGLQEQQFGTAGNPVMDSSGPARDGTDIVDNERSSATGSADSGSTKSGVGIGKP